MPGLLVAAYGWAADELGDQVTQGIFRVRVVGDGCITSMFALFCHHDRARCGLPPTSGRPTSEATR